MTLDQLIKLAQEAKEKYGNIHVVFEDELDYTVKKIDYSKESNIAVLCFDEPEFDFARSCGDADCETYMDVKPMSELYMYNENHLVCKECFENNHEYRLYAENVYGFELDDNGEYTIKNYIYKDGKHLWLNEDCYKEKIT